MGELQASMLADEFTAWKAFYRLYPFDDFHRFHRPAALVSVSMSGGKIEDALDYLQPAPAGSTDELKRLMG